MIEIVRASEKDACLLAETRRAAWLETYRGIYPDEMLDGYDLALYAMRDWQRIAARTHHYYLFADGEKCAGYFSYGPSNFGSYKDFSLCLNNLYILNGYKRMGLGSQAFAAVREYCRQEGIDKFFCGCNVNNQPAVAFYRHMGGIQGDEPLADAPKEDQIIHFEFYLGD